MTHTNVANSLTGLIRFGALGGVTLATNIALTTFLHRTMGMAAELSFALSLATVIVISFVGCRYMIFQAASEGDLKRQAALFLLSSLGFRGTEYLGFLMLHTLLGLHYLMAIVAVCGASFLAKFFYFRHAVFISSRQLIQSQN